MLASAVEKVEQKITQLEMEEDMLCSSSNPSQMRQALGNMKSAGVDIVNIVLGVVCAAGIALMLWGAVGIIKAGPATGSTASATGATTKTEYATAKGWIAAPP